MQLIIGAGTVTQASRDIMPATGTPGWATDGNPALGIPPTDDLACHYNMMMAEIVQVILDAGAELDATDWGQLSAAIKALIALEAVRATTVESNLTARIGQEETRAQSAEQNVSGAWNFIYSTTTLTAPAWATRLEIWMTGGGGGGAGCQGTSTSGAISGGGGASGATVYAMLSVGDGVNVGLTVGSGGTPGVGTAPAGSGGDSSVSVGGTVLVTAKGGFGATWYSANGSAGAAPADFASEGTSGVLSIAQIKGGHGGDGQAGQYMLSGNGAASHWGGGGRAGSTAGLSGQAWGAGGGGAYDSNGTGASCAGGSGAQGAIMYRFLP